MCAKAADIIDLRSLDPAKRRELEEWLERCKRDLEAQVKDLEQALDKIRRQ
jgi:hypothetical protein